MMMVMLVILIILSETRHTLVYDVRRSALRWCDFHFRNTVDWVQEPHSHRSLQSITAHVSQPTCSTCWRYSFSA